MLSLNIRISCVCKKEKMPKKNLTSVDIGKRLKHVKSFVGVFPINKVHLLCPPKNIAVSFIANLQPDDLPGNHWVAVHRTKEYSAIYFDSFGTIPPAEIQHWLVKNSGEWSWNKRQVQKDSDMNSCGYLCIKFIKSFV